jgi:hypothetical protein
MRICYAILFAIGLGLVGEASAQTDLIDVVPGVSLTVPGKGQFVVFHPSLPLAAVGVQRVVLVYGLEDGRSSEIAQCPKGSPVAGASSRDASRLAVGCDDGSILLSDWEAHSPPVVISRGQGKSIASVNFSPDSTEVVSAGEDKTVVVWDVVGRREIRRFTEPKRPLIFAGFTTNAVSIVALTDNGQLFEWDSKTGRSLRQSSLTDNSVLSGALNTAGTLLAIGTEFAQLSKMSLLRSADPADFHREDRLLLYDLGKGAIVKQIEEIDGQLRGLSFSADNRFLAATRQKTKHTYLSVFDLQRGVEVFSQEAIDGARLAGFSPNGSYLAGLSLQGQLAVFKVKGIQLAAAVGDLAGQKIRSTSPSEEPLLRSSSSLTLAIMDLDSLGLEKDVGRSVSEMLRNRIVGANLRVVATDRMQAIIKQQNFQLSDRTDSLTAVALGKILNANKMIFGSVSALGTTYTVDVQLVDVETARVEGIREIMCQRCGLEDLPAVVAQLQALLVSQ